MMWTPKSPFLVFTAFWLLIGYQCPQVHGEVYKMTYNPSMFDDQYIGCSDKLEKDIMPKVLHKEKEYQQFNNAWISAAERWEDIKDDLELPEGFTDEYGIALLTFTNDYPAGNPIYQQMNGNLTIAGASRKDYMDKFHFKALHFYLTRALQMLKPNCEESYTTYKGSPHSFHVRPVFKFGRFTSTSLNLEEALVFGTESRFQITTCFGAKIDDFSFFPSEEEVLIPPTEKFLYVTKQNSFYIFRSIGQMCSYFNCAYLEEEKREVAVCRSDTNEEPEDETTMKTMMSTTETEERINVLEDQISQNYQYRDHHQARINDIITFLNDKAADDESLRSWVEDLTTLVVPLLEIEDKMMNLQESLTSLREELRTQHDLIRSLLERETSILQTILHHRKLLTSLQEETGKQKGIMELITSIVVAGFSIHKFYHQFINRV